MQPRSQVYASLRRRREAGDGVVLALLQLFFDNDERPCSARGDATISTDLMRTHLESHKLRSIVEDRGR